MPTIWDIESSLPIREKHAHRVGRTFKKVLVKKPGVRTFSKRPSYEELLVKELKKLKLV